MVTELEQAVKPPFLPSRHQIGDRIKIEFISVNRQFNPDDPDTSGRVIGVHFYPGKVKYDIEVGINEFETTRIYNIDSLFVHSICVSINES